MVKSWTRLLACMGARSSGVEGWHEKLALSFPFCSLENIADPNEVFNFKMIPYFSSISDIEKQPHFAYWFNDKTLEIYINKFGYRLIDGEDKDDIEDIINAFVIRNERLNFVALCKYFKTTPPPYDVENIAPDYKRIYELDMALQDMKNINVPKQTKDNTAEVLAAQKKLDKYKQDLKDLVNSWDVAQWTS